MRIRILTMLALGLASVCGTASGAETTTDSQAACYSFRSDVCLQDFDLISETITHPVDFTIDEIELHPKTHVTIYEGFGLAEQQDVTGITTPLTYEAAAARIEVVTGRAKSGLYFDVHYISQHGRYSSTTQFFGVVSSTEQAQAISEFLDGVHPCQHDSPLGIACTADRPLERAAQFLTGLVK